MLPPLPACVLGDQYGVLPCCASTFCRSALPAADTSDTSAAILFAILFAILLFADTAAVSMLPLPPACVLGDQYGAAPCCASTFCRSALPAAAGVEGAAAEAASSRATAAKRGLDGFQLPAFVFIVRLLDV